MSEYRTGAICTLLLCAALRVDAGTVASRDALNAMLGAGGTTENFQEFGVPANTTEIIRSPLIMSGLSISYPPNGFLELYGQGYYGQPSIDLSGNGTGGPTLLFTNSVNAIGFDLLGFAGYSSSIVVDVLGLDLTTSLYLSGSITMFTMLDNPIAPIFFGYADNAGIGAVELIGGGEPTIVDNVTFGSTPEPQPLLLLGAAFSAMGVCIRCAGKGDASRQAWINSRT